MEKAIESWKDVVVQKVLAHLGSLETASFEYRSYYEIYEDEVVFDVVTLDERERAITRTDLTKFLTKFIDAIRGNGYSYGWLHTASIINMLHQFVNNYSFENEKITRAVTVNIEGSVDQMKELESYFGPIGHDVSTWNLDDLMMSTNQQIIYRLKYLIRSKSQLQKIKILLLLRKRILKEHDLNHWYLTFHYEEQSTRRAKRDSSLTDELSRLIFLYTPMIKFNSKDEITDLKSFISQIVLWVISGCFHASIDGDGVIHSPLISRFDQLIEFKSSIVKHPRYYPNYDGSKISSNSSDIIRYLVSVLRKINKNPSAAESLNIKLWINYIFLEEPGFSLEHILKAPNRDSKKTNQASF